MSSILLFQFLNAFWERGLPNGQGLNDQAEKFWQYVDKMAQIDKSKAAGNALDELEAHRFLEAFDEVMRHGHSHVV